MAVPFYGAKGALRKSITSPHLTSGVEIKQERNHCRPKRKRERFDFATCTRGVRHKKKRRGQRLPMSGRLLGVSEQELVG